MEDSTVRDLQRVTELEHTARYLSLHASEHGIKLDKRSRLFFIIFSRFKKECREFNASMGGRRMHILKALSLQEARTHEPISDPMYSKYSILLESHRTIIKKTFEAFEKPVWEVIKNEELEEKANSASNLSHNDYSWVNELPHHNWALLYQYFKQLEDIEWEFLFLKPEELLQAKASYDILKDQYCVLRLVELLPNLRSLSSKISNYNEEVKNNPALEALYFDWNLFTKELIELYRKWTHVTSSIKGTELNIVGETLIEAYDALFKNYNDTIKETLEIFEDLIFSVIGNKQLKEKIKSVRTLNNNDDSWVNELPRYDWEVLYQYLHQLQDIEWSFLLIKPEELPEVKRSYYELKDQYSALRLVKLLPNLRRLSSRICNLRYETINYNQEIQNISILETLHSDWNILSKEFKEFSSKWTLITSSINGKKLNTVSKTLIKAYDSLVDQYYTLLNSHLPILSTTSQASLQSRISIFTRPPIRGLTPKRSQYDLSASAQKAELDKERLDGLLSRALSEFIPLNPHNSGDYSEASSCITTIMV